MMGDKLALMRASRRVPLKWPFRDAGMPALLPDADKGIDGL